MVASHPAEGQTHLSGSSRLILAVGHALWGASSLQPERQRGDSQVYFRGGADPKLLRTVSFTATFPRLRPRGLKTKTKPRWVRKRLFWWRKTPPQKKKNLLNSHLNRSRTQDPARRWSGSVRLGPCCCRTGALPRRSCPLGGRPPLPPRTGARSRFLGSRCVCRCVC